MKRIACIVMLACVVGCGDSPPPQVEAPTPTLEQIAYAAAKEKIPPAILTPATTQFPADTIKVSDADPFTTIDGEKWPMSKVTGHVDAQNTYGALIRNSWTVYLLTDAAPAKVASVELDGNVIYRDSAYQRELARIQEAADAERVRNEVAAIEATRREKRLAIEAEEKLKAERLDAMRKRVDLIPAEIQAHRDALSKLPERPAGGPVFGEVERHRNEINRLEFELETIRKRLAELK